MQWLKIACVCLILVTVPVIIESCCLNDCCGQNVTRASYNVNDFTLIVTPHPIVHPFPTVTGSSHTLKGVAFLVELDVSYISKVIGSPGGFTAVACDPVPPTSNQTVSSILITSNSTFTTTSRTVTANSSLNEFFKVYTANGSYPTDDLIGSEYLESFFLRTDDELNKPQTHTFTIAITLDDGRVFTLVSDRLELAQG